MPGLWQGAKGAGTFLVEGWETLIPPLFKASARYACAVTHGELKLLLAEFGLYHFDAVLGGLAKPGGGTDGVGAWRYRRYGRGLGARGCLQCCRGTRAQRRATELQLGVQILLHVHAHLAQLKSAILCSAIARLGRFQHQKVVPRRRRGVNQRKAVQRRVNHGELVPNLLPQDWAQRPPHPWWRVAMTGKFSKLLLRSGDLSQNGMAISATMSTTQYLLSTSSKQRNKYVHYNNYISISQYILYTEYPSLHLTPSESFWIPLYESLWSILCRRMQFGMAFWCGLIRFDALSCALMSWSSRHCSEGLAILLQGSFTIEGRWVMGGTASSQSCLGTSWKP